MIYFDNSATTKISDKVLEEMTNTYKNFWGNPSSIHTVGQGAKEILELNRYLVASAFNVSPEKIIFTSGGTESDNFALVGTALKRKKGHIISTQMEHPAILNTLKLLEDLGYQFQILRAVCSRFPRRFQRSSPLPLQGRSRFGSWNNMGRKL